MIEFDGPIEALNSMVDWVKSGRQGAFNLDPEEVFCALLRKFCKSIACPPIENAIRRRYSAFVEQAGNLGFPEAVGAVHSRAMAAMDVLMHEPWVEQRDIDSMKEFRRLNREQFERQAAVVGYLCECQMFGSHMIPDFFNLSQLLGLANKIVTGAEELAFLHPLFYKPLELAMHHGIPIIDKLYRYCHKHHFLEYAIIDQGMKSDTSSRELGSFWHACWNQLALYESSLQDVWGDLPRLLRDLPDDGTWITIRPTVDVRLIAAGFRLLTNQLGDQQAELSTMIEAGRIENQTPTESIEPAIPSTVGDSACPTAAAVDAPLSDAPMAEKAPAPQHEDSDNLASLHAKCIYGPLRGKKKQVAEAVAPLSGGERRKYPGKASGRK